MITRDDIMRRFDDFCARSGFGWAYARPLALERAGKTGDFDILVGRGHISDCIGFLRAQKDISVTRVVPRVDGTTVFIFAADFGFTHIDFMHTLGVRGVPFAQTHEMIVRATRDDFWSVLHHVDLAVLLLMTHGVKHAAPPKPDYARFIADVLRDHDDALSARLLGLLGGDAMLDIRDAVRAGDLNRVNWRGLRRKFLLRGNIAANMARAAWYAVHDMECRLMTRKHSIAFFGVDGAGKTTVIHALRDALNGAAHHVRHCHVFPLLPNMPEPDSTKTMAAPHAHKNRGPLGSMAKAVYVWARFWVGYVWPWRGAVLFLFDRHMADMVADPRRYRYGGSGRFLMGLLRRAPRLDMAVLVDIDPHIAHKRKPELPLAEVRRQTDAYRNLIWHLPNPIKINGADPVHDNVNRILRSFLQVTHG